MSTREAGTGGEEKERKRVAARFWPKVCPKMSGFCFCQFLHTVTHASLSISASSLFFLDKSSKSHMPISLHNDGTCIHRLKESAAAQEGSKRERERGGRRLEILDRATNLHNISMSMYLPCSALPEITLGAAQLKLRFTVSATVYAYSPRTCRRRKRVMQCGRKRKEGRTKKE